ncbi:DUF4150 domain-containing protein [Rhizobium sullae]|uniref:DUF4150 domain-containing protein n=1 Tax=Rhizobium sullae TaxID=50338 RepID=UPI001FCDF54E|nr:DUF4150 domain-containing protein [Rhizobium sullae]
MSNVFANGLEISGKAVNAQTIAAFPDVCFTPPQTPATPPGVPIPYPSFGVAADTENGTGTVKIGSKEVNIKNKSDEKRTSGTEAGCAPKKGIITSKNTGKKYFHKWSPDVKFEGEPVIRFTDLATHNHASPQGQTPPWPELAKLNPGWTNTCDKVYAEYMTTYDPNSCKTPEYQAHHIVDNACFARPGGRVETMESFKDGPKLGKRAWKVLKNLFQKGSQHPGRKYHEGDAPSICLRGDRFKNPRSQHAKAHNISDEIAANHPTAPTTGKWTYKEARQAGLESIQKAASLTDRETECVGYMLDAYYKQKLGCTDTTEVRAPGTQPSTGQTFDTGRGVMASMSPRPL